MDVIAELVEDMSDIQQLDDFLTIINSYQCFTFYTDETDWMEVETQYDYAYDTRLRGKLHSCHGKPAYVLYDHAIAWYKHGKLHRDDFIEHEGSVLSLPAMLSNAPSNAFGTGLGFNYIRTSGYLAAIKDMLTVCSKELPSARIALWCNNGKLHNTSKFGGFSMPASFDNFDIHWCVNGKKHNTDVITGLHMPATYTIYDLEWCINDEYIRLDEELKPAHINLDYRGELSEVYYI